MTSVLRLLALKGWCSPLSWFAQCLSHSSEVLTCEGVAKLASYLGRRLDELGSSGPVLEVKSVLARPAVCAATHIFSCAHRVERQWTHQARMAQGSDRCPVAHYAGLRGLRSTLVFAQRDRACACAGDRSVGTLAYAHAVLARRRAA